MASKESAGLLMFRRNGGGAPAKIWGQYMKVARGSYCGAFPQPKVAFRPQPFFGSYSTTGSARDPR